MEAGLMEIVLSVNRSWIDDAYFSIGLFIRGGSKSWGNVRGQMSGYGRECVAFCACPNSFQFS